MIAGNYISEEATTVEESKCPVYGFIRKVDYHRETVRYSLNNFRWFAALVRHTVVSIGRSLFNASDQVCGYILNNHDKDIIMEALHNVAEQPDFEQELNYFVSPEDRNKAMESYIGKMIGYTATEWVRAKLKELEQNISFEGVLEERGDSVFAEIVKELGLEDAEVKRLVDELHEATTETEDEDYEKMQDALEEENETLVRDIEGRLQKECIFVDDTGVFRDCRLSVVVAMAVFGMSQGLAEAKAGSICDSLMRIYKGSPIYVLTSEKEEDSKASFSSAMKFGIAFAEVCGFGEVSEELLSDKMYAVVTDSSLSALTKYSMEYIENRREILVEGNN